MENFDLKVESMVGLKLDPGFRVIEEYLSQIDSILRVKLSIKLLIKLQCISYQIGNCYIYSKFFILVLQVQYRSYSWVKADHKSSGHGLQLFQMRLMKAVWIATAVERATAGSCWLLWFITLSEIHWQSNSCIVHRSTYWTYKFIRK